VNDILAIVNLVGYPLEDLFGVAGVAFTVLLWGFLIGDFFTTERRPGPPTILASLALLCFGAIELLK
jgi:hypothetical protein